MPATDLIHNAVKKALVKDGWTITADPYTLVVETLKLYVDLAAEMPIAAERAGRKIAVEIKSFLSPSPVKDFQNALGQYLMYRGFMETHDPDRKLYLAVGSRVFHSVFEDSELKFIVDRYQLEVVIIDLESEEITQWTS